MVNDAKMYIAETYSEIVRDSNSPIAEITFFDGIVSALIEYPIVGASENYIDYFVIYSAATLKNFLYVYPGDSVYIENLWALNQVPQQLGKNLSPVLHMIVPYQMLSAGAHIYVTKFRLRGGLNP